MGCAFIDGDSLAISTRRANAAGKEWHDANHILI
jgi:hypothetical protein